MSTQNNSKIAQVSRSQPMLMQHRREIQDYGSLRELPVALDFIARGESCTLVNHILEIAFL
jgi:starvation-inducible DNA-binding protein